MPGPRVNRKALQKGITMTVSHTQPDLGRERLIDQLRELIRALDSRAPHLEREGETQIANDAAALKQKAIERLAQLER